MPKSRTSMRRNPTTVLDYCVAKHGLHRGAFTAAYACQHAICMVDIGHLPTHREYAEYWAVDERSSKNHRARVRDVFGDEWEAVVRQLATYAQRTGKWSPGALRRHPVTA